MFTLANLLFATWMMVKVSPMDLLSSYKNTIISPASCKWETSILYVSNFSPLTESLSTVLVSILLRASTTKVKTNGERGHLVLNSPKNWNQLRGFSLTITAKNCRQPLIRLCHLTLNPLASITLYKKPQLTWSYTSSKSKLSTKLFFLYLLINSTTSFATKEACRICLPLTKALWLSDIVCLWPPLRLFYVKYLCDDLVDTYH